MGSRSTIYDGSFKIFAKYFYSPKYREWPFYKLFMTEVSRNLRNIFFGKIPSILKIEVGFLSKYRESRSYKLFMTEVSRNLRNIFLAKIPPILKIEVGIFSAKKSFFGIFENINIFFT